MTDQTPETTQDADIFAGTDHEATKTAINNVLTLDQILSSARLVERTVSVCMRGDLEAEYKATIAKLSRLVDDEGNLLAEEPTLADQSEAADLNDKASELWKQMQPAMLTIKFRAMDSDEWVEFDEARRDSQNRMKDQRSYENDLIATCAVEGPVSTVADVEKLRKKTNRAQFVKFSNGAFFVNTQDGIDVPFSPSFLAAPKPQE